MDTSSQGKFGKPVLNLIHFEHTMKYSISIILIITLNACGKPRPTFNPFDTLFDADIVQIRNECTDTISAGCGYFNLTKNHGNHQVYYQVREGQNEVFAKGIVIPLDTFIFPYYSNGKNDNSIESILRHSPVDTGGIDQILAQYGLIRKFKKSGKNQNVWIYISPDNKEFHFSIDYEDEKSNDSTFVRIIDCFISKD